MSAHQGRRDRSPNLTESSIREILDVIDGWAEAPLSWGSLLARVQLRLGAAYSRQALHRHSRIAEAFARRRLEVVALPKAKSRGGSVEVQKARETINRLQAKIERLEAENRILTEQFLVWLYNANARGVTVEQLSRPLPPSARR